MAGIGIGDIFHIIHVSETPFRFTTWDVPGDPRD